MDPIFCAVHIVPLPLQHDSALLYLFPNPHHVMLLFLLVCKENQTLMLIIFFQQIELDKTSHRIVYMPYTVCLTISSLFFICTRGHYCCFSAKAAKQILKG